MATLMRPPPATSGPTIKRNDAGVRFPRLRVVLITLWVIYILWTGLHFAWDIVDAIIGPSDPYGFSDAREAALVTAPFDLWACIGACFFGVVARNPRRWTNGKRFALGAMAFGMMLGRLSVLPVMGLAAIPFGWFTFVFFIIAPLMLTAGGAVVIAFVAAFITLFFGFFVAIPASMFHAVFQFERDLKQARYESSGLLNYLARFVLWLRNESPPAPMPDDSKGARFADPREIQALRKPDSQAAMAFGHLGGPVFLETDKHVLIMASTRSGKGVTLIIPHLLRYRGSAFVLDPKGENAQRTGRQRGLVNDKVHYLDPFGITGKPQSRFNPLARFTPDNMEAESKALAAALFVVTGGQRDHWTDSGQQLLAAVILYVFLADKIPPEVKDLGTVRKCLLGDLKNTLEDMQTIDAADGLLIDLAASFIATPPNEFGSIASTAKRQTEILDNPHIVKCLSASGDGPQVDFADWHKGTMSVFLCLSAPKFPTFNRWLRLVLTSALDEMTDRLDPPKLPVCFMLDELATLGHLEAVENAVGLSAGYGIQLISVFQDVAQMRDLYKGRWASFIGNAGVRAVFNVDDFNSSEYWSKFVGDRLVETRSAQQDLLGYSRGDNVGEAMRPLIPTDKLMLDYAAGKMLVLAQGSHPIETQRVAYFKDRSLDGLWDDPRKPVPKRPAGAKPSSPPGAPTPTPGPAAPSTPPKGPPPPPQPPPSPRPSNGAAPRPQAPRPAAAEPSPMSGAALDIPRAVAMILDKIADHRSAENRGKAIKEFLATWAQASDAQREGLAEVYDHIENNLRLNIPAIYDEIAGWKAARSSKPADSVKAIIDRLQRSVSPEDTTSAHNRAVRDIRAAWPGASNSERSALAALFRDRVPKSSIRSLAAIDDEIKAWREKQNDDRGR